jgi:WD40 repeat protein
MYDFNHEKTLKGHQRWVWDCAFSADSAYLVTGESGLHIKYDGIDSLQYEPLLIIQRVCGKWRREKLSGNTMVITKVCLIPSENF